MQSNSPFPPTIFNRRSAVRLLGGLLAGTHLGFGATSSSRIKVALCFDGSKSHAKLKDIVNFGNELTRLSGLPAKFTMYANSTYWHTGGLDTPDIGYGGSEKDIAKRVQLTQNILNAGHEMGSHTVRHFNGKEWSFKQWDTELHEFDQHVAQRFSAQNGSPYKCTGFRAPYLAINDNLYKALKKNNYTYDFSQVGRPIESRHGILTISVPTWKRDNGEYTISMDYNWQDDKVSNNEVSAQLQKELSNPVILLSLHFANYKAPGASKSYYNLVKDFCRVGAKNRRFEFVTMKSYTDGLKTEKKSTKKAINTRSRR